MAIPVVCGCGRKYRAKDDLAGRMIRCPACKAGVRVPPVRLTGPSAECEKPRRDRGRKFSAGRGAAALPQPPTVRSGASRGKNAGKPAGRPADASGDRTAKRRALTRVADVCGAVCRSLGFRYILIFGLLCGGAVGSVFLTQAVATYRRQPPGERDIKQRELAELYTQAEKAIAAKRWGEAGRLLEEVLQLEPRQETSPRFRNLKRRQTEGFETSRATTSEAMSFDFALLTSRGCRPTVPSGAFKRTT